MDYSVEIIVASAALALFVAVIWNWATVSQWARRKYDGLGILMRLVDTRTRASEIMTKSFLVNDSNQSATITYEHLGTKNMIFVPYSPDHISSMVQLTVQLERNDGKMIDITQSPGIPYLVSAADLGGKRIRAINYITEHEHDYGNITAPGYCSEVL